jgi:hypothetical protein
MSTNEQKPRSGARGKTVQKGKEQVDLLKIVPITPKARAELEKLSPTIQQFLLRFLDMHDEDVISKVLRYVENKNIADSNTLAKQIADIMAQNQTILEYTESTNKMVLEIKEAHEKRIRQLEEDVKLLNPEIIREALHEWEQAEPKLSKIMASQKRIFKLGAVIVAIILITATVLTWHIVKDKPVEPIKVETLR